MKAKIKYMITDQEFYEMSKDAQKILSVGIACLLWKIELQMFNSLIFKR